MGKILRAMAVLLVASTAAAQSTAPSVRSRASDLGLKIGILPTGPLDAITDVAGVQVGQTTIIRGDDVRTGSVRTAPVAYTHHGGADPAHGQDGIRALDGQRLATAASVGGGAASDGLNPQ
jgi:hypothetical protein